MTEALADWAVPVTAWLLTYLIHSTILLGTVWILTRWGFPSRPGAVDVLWKVALLGGIVTSVAVFAGPSSKEVRVEARMVRAGPVGASTVTVRPLANRTVTVPQSESLHGGPTPATPLRYLPPRMRLDRCRSVIRGPGGGPLRWLDEARAECDERGGGWPVGLGLLWLFGAGVAGAGLIRRRRSLAAALGDVRSAKARTRLMLEGVAAGAGECMPVCVSDTVVGPCVVGRTVVLSRRSEEELPTAQLEAVLAHEVAHVARRDSGWSVVADMLVALFWFQPLLRVARSSLRDVSELICDDWAVSHIRRPVELARSIARVAEWAMPGRVATGVAMARRGEPGLAGRVRRIVQGGSRPVGEGRRWALALAGLILAPMLFIPTVPTVQEVHAVEIHRSTLQWTGDVEQAVAGTRILVRTLPPGTSAR